MEEISRTRKRRQQCDFGFPSSLYSGLFPRVSFVVLLLFLGSPLGSSLSSALVAQDSTEDGEWPRATLTPSAGMLVSTGPWETAQVYAIRLDVELGSRFGLGGRVEGHWVGSHREAGGIEADFLWQLSGQIAETGVTGLAGVFRGSGVTAYLAGFRGSVLIAADTPPGDEYAQVPPIQFVLELRSGWVREGQNGDGRATGIASIAIALPLRRSRGSR